MPLIDEFAAMFCNVSVREIIASSPATAAQARVCFVYCDDDATLLKTISAGYPARPAPTTTTRVLVAICLVANNDDGNASPTVAVEIVRINLRRDMAKWFVGPLLVSDWAAADAA